MAAKNSMPERAIAQTENSDLDIQQENREKLRKKRIRALHDEPVHSAYLHERGEADYACVELYTRMERNYLPLTGAWLTRAGFKAGIAVKIRVMPDCIVITPQNSRELWGCLEGVSATYTNKLKMMKWLETFPGALIDTGDLPVNESGKG